MKGWAVAVGCTIIVGLAATLAAGCGSTCGSAGPSCGSAMTGGCAMGAASASQEVASMEFEVRKTDEEWRAMLTPQQFDVARKKGTEPAFDNEYWNFKGDGVYRCVCCGAPLFASDAKYDSGTGWPSFSQTLNGEAVVLAPDHSLDRVRTEVLCARCGGHLGHVFDDGPQPMGLRYCMNSASLEFVPKKEATEE
jgi:peptide-methionine (R)-S-oxide reductase